MSELVQAWSESTLIWPRLLFSFIFLIWVFCILDSIKNFYQRVKETKKK